MKNLLAPYAKSIAAAIVGAINVITSGYGLDLSERQVATITGVIVTAIVFLIPNKTTEA